MYNKIVKVAAQKLASEEIQTQLSALKGWALVQDSIQKEFKLKDFEQTWVSVLLFREIM
jgi:pterin-4a-carbinolamine dehydratase